MIFALFAFAVTVADLDTVNRAVQHDIRPMTDMQHYGVEDVWIIEPRDKDGIQRGDCEDYALTNRARLLRLGVPAEAMKVAIVKTPTGLHAILEVTLPGPDRSTTYVLDNLDKEVRPLTYSLLMHHYKPLIASNLITAEIPTGKPK